MIEVPTLPSEKKINIVIPIFFFLSKYLVLLSRLRSVSKYLRGCPTYPFGVRPGSGVYTSTLLKDGMDQAQSTLRVSPWMAEIETKHGFLESQDLITCRAIGHFTPGQDHNGGELPVM